MAKCRISKGPNIPHKALHSRISYLYQAATFLASQPRGALGVDNSKAEHIAKEPPTEEAAGSNAEKEPDYSQADSRRLLSDLQEISLKMQIRLSPSIKHSMCKRCDILLVDGSTCASDVENKSKNGKKPWADVLVRKCVSCGFEKRFPYGAERQPRRPYRDAAADVKASKA